MASILNGNELARVFVPTRDFDLSKRFYEALGFEKTLDGEVAIFDKGSFGEEGGALYDQAIQVVLRREPPDRILN